MREVCAAWAVPATGAIEDEPVRSDIPTLILNGARDPVTPPAQGELAAASLSQHYIFTFPTLGHGSAWQSWFDPCPGTIARAFLADPTREPDSSCIPATPPTRFLTNADIHATPAIYRLNSDVIGPRPPATLALLGLTGVVFLGAVVGSVVCLARRRSGVRRPALALTTGVLNLGFVGGLYAVLASADRLILGFGVPPGARWLSLLPLLALVAAGVLFVEVTRDMVSVGSTPGRRRRVQRTLPYAVVALAGMAFAAWLLSCGLLIL